MPHSRQITSTRVADDASTDALSWGECALLAMTAGAGVTGILKGLSPTIVNGAEFYWLVTYEHGFIRRALIGTLFHPLLTLTSFEHLKPLIVAAHVVLCVLIVLICQVLFGRAVKRERRLEVRVTLLVSLLLLMSSELMPVLANGAGLLDVYIVSIVLVAFWMTLNGRYVAAAATAAIGPFVHESFIFLWLPVAVMLVWSLAATGIDVRRKAVAALLPVCSTALAVVCHSEAAATAAVQALPLSDEVKSGITLYQFGQTLVSSFDHMRMYEFPGNVGHVEITAAYFLIPSAGILCATAFCYWHRWSTPWMTMTIGVVAGLCPLTVLALAWDLSRFLVWSNLSAALVLIALGSPGFVPEGVEPWRSEPSPVSC